MKELLLYFALLAAVYVWHLRQWKQLERLERLERQEEQEPDD